MILNRQRKVRVAVRALDRFLARACTELRVSADDLTVCLVTNSHMARWNGKYRGKDRPTDVLSFPSGHSKSKSGAGRRRSRTAIQKAGTSSATTDSYLGDIAIAPLVARSNAKEYGRTFDEEMRILMIHGILHLLGYDHETDSGQMNRRERRVRRALGLE